MAHSGFSRKRVAILTFSEVTRDPRIRRAAELMVKRGHEVRVYTFQFESTKAIQDYAGFRIIRLPHMEKVNYDPSLLFNLLGDIAGAMYSLWPDLFSFKVSLLGRAALYAKRAAKRNLRPETIVYLRRLLRKAPRGPVSSGNATMNSNPKLGSLKQANQNDDLYDSRQRMLLNLELFNAVGPWSTHVYANDLETLFAGVMLKHKYNTRLIYDAHEIWPHQWSLEYRSAQFVGFYSAMERVLIKETDERITVGEGLANYFKYAYASEAFTVIPNTPSIKNLVHESVLQRRLKRRGILYHGIYAPYRGLEEIIAVQPLLDDCRLAFRGIGTHEEVLRCLATDNGGRRVEFLESLPMDKLIAGAAEFDIGLLPFVNSCLNTNYAFPNKMFEYMMAGLAIAATDLIDQRRIVMQHQMGVVFDINDREKVAMQLNQLLRNSDLLDEMRRNAWKAARDIYNWENLSGEFAKVLSRCEL